MSVTSLILELLQKQPEVSVAGFGTFYLKKISAALGSDGKSILPPGKEIAFKSGSDSKDESFAQFYAEQKDISLEKAQEEIKKQVTFWNLSLEKDGTVNSEELGTFFLNDSQLHFNGVRLASTEPDFYGLEEIKLAEIGSRKIKNAEKSASYKFSNWIYWLIALILIISAVSYMAVTKPEMLFGEKSFTENKEPKAAVKIAPVVPKIDTLQQQKIADSLKTDSLRKADSAKVLPVRKTYKSKKYRSNKYRSKKYYK